MSTNKVTKGARPSGSKLTTRAGESLSREVEGKDHGQQVDKLFSDWGGSGETPGAAVLVVRDGKVLHEKGYGLARVSRHGSAPVEIGPHTIFELASVSKQFTAMAVMVLKQEGMLGYDDLITMHFDFRAPEAKEVRILDLLNHRSGVPEYSDIFTAANLVDRHYPRSAESDPGRFEPRVNDVVKALAEQYEFTFAPGARYTYSNSGYVLLAKIIEKVSGMSYPKFMREHIFMPLGMKNTFVYQKSSPAPKHAAQGHDRGWSTFNEIDYTPLDYIYGDGSVQSNLTDMRKWVEALDDLTSSGAGGGGIPVRRETFREALAKRQETDTPGVDYAFGWFLGQARGLDGIWHSGSWGGYRTMIMRFPGQRFTVVVLSNVAHLMPTFMAAKVATCYLEDEMDPLGTPKVPEELLLPFAKRYMDTSGDYYDVTQEPAPGGGRALFLKYSTLDKFKLVPVLSDDKKFRGEFFIEGLLGFDAFRFTLDERKKIIKVPSRPKAAGQTQRPSPPRTTQAY